jgi:hypothetical protein
MNVLFISPHFPPEMNGFTLGLAEVGAKVYAIGDVPAGQLPEATRRALSGYVQCANLFDDSAVIATVREQMRGLEIDRIECLWEPFVVLAARLRETFGIPGMSVEKVVAFRDKDLMKKKIRAGGIRTSKSRRARTAQELRDAAEAIGFPVIFKPIAGAGSADTYRLDSQQDIDRILPHVRHVTEANIEEYIDGDEEYTFDCITIGGKPAFWSVTQYFPRPLDGRLHEWISPGQLTFRDIEQPRIAEGVRMGFDAVKAMEMETGFVHMEWFRKANGEIVFGEIGCRSGGGNLMDMINYANDMNVYREWASAVCHGRIAEGIERKYNCAMVFKRAEGQGRISRIEGTDALRAKFGEWLVWENLLPIGAPRRDWTQTLVSDGFWMVRHPDYQTAYDMMMEITTRIRMYAS